MHLALIKIEDYDIFIIDGADECLFELGCVDN